MNIFQKFPTIDLKHINIKLIELNTCYSEDFFEYISDPLVHKYITCDNIPKNLLEAKNELIYWINLFHNQQSIYWGILDTVNNKLIGSCGFNCFHPIHRKADLSYELSSKYWNKGITTNCLREICKFAFNLMKINRIQSTVAIKNFSSIRVLEKLNFTKEGELQEYEVLHGIKTNFYIYSLLKDDNIF